MGLLIIFFIESLIRKGFIEEFMLSACNSKTLNTGCVLSLVILNICDNSAVLMKLF